MQTKHFIGNHTLRDSLIQLSVRGANLGYRGPSDLLHTNLKLSAFVIFMSFLTKIAQLRTGICNFKRYSYTPRHLIHKG